MTSLNFLQIFQIILLLMYFIFSGAIVSAAIRNTLDANTRFFAIVAYVILWMIMSFVTHHILISTKLQITSTESFPESVQQYPVTRPSNEPPSFPNSSAPGP